jgi:transcriptional regulator with XRE-family HTH domain
MKMKQPELGRKIADLRKAKGYTQEELVDKCNLSVRTLQRIESGEVVPRSHTIRVIFAALDYKVYDSSNIRLRLFFKQVIDVFNLKTNTMKKLSILTVIFAAAVLGLLSICMDGFAQSDVKVRKIITENNANYIRWFNSGQADSVLTLYAEDACMLGQGCGKEYLREYFRSGTGVFRFEEMNVISLSVSGKIAVEKGRWLVSTTDGTRISGEYLTEWHRVDKKKWLIVNDISTTD